ncbi:BatA domain-containing protein [Phycisphaera mikurensis]|uniref:Aerotolerance regulator N-terminal domain-containing protein n=1 Tax=Phycisphaera mikurensis (strain NBRC 102666 / KCTC 22515 / FYK2301M01) TaxID=1142394 RepID=I0IIF9_PHYMF|nr:BatA domain-containing protein [Phycisphaera mikurensis]MBB6442389.1 hypothetical protein [Phycisphaera mikurensis]BAM05047.1 hypothetical protein PSMK_28880 [Phycisphaera mikurensis NBRC 102666]
MQAPFVLAQAAASLVAPALAVAGVAAVAVPVTLHLLSRRRRKQRPWAAMRFLREAIQKQRRRLRFERWLLLGCRCLLLVLLGLALAGPLVSGRLASALGVAGAAGRSVDLVIDNGIASGARLPGEEDAFLARSLREADAVLASLDPADRVRIWPLAGGGDAGDPPSLAPAAARQRVAGLGVTDAAPAREAVLPRVAEAARADAAAGREAAVVVLSPHFPEEGVAGRGPWAPEGGNGVGPRVWLSRPAAGVPNLALGGVRPTRAVVAAGDAAASRSAGRLEALVRVRRAGEAAGAAGAAADASVVVKLVEPAAAAGFTPLAALAERPALATGRREVTLDAGVAEAVVRVPLEAPEPLAPGRRLLLATLDPPAGDAVAADDAGLARVELVEAVRVGLLGGESADGGLAPSDFAAAALGEGTGFAVRPLGSPVALVPPGGGDDTLDAVVTLDPAALGPAGRASVAAFVAAGGAAWVTPSAAAPEDEPGAGLGALFEALGLPWRPSPAAEGAEGPIRADASRPAPATLALLAGQWEALLRPLRIDRLAAPAGVDPADVWIRSAAGVPLTASARSAEAAGRVVYLATALDPAWTNLPAKPLFPALLRDGLLAAVAARAEAEPAVAAAGDATGGRAGLSGGTVVSPAPADTTGQAASRVAAAYAGLGPVAFLPADDPAAAFAGDPARASLAAGLLWVVLALLVLEALAGRAWTR